MTNNNQTERVSDEELDQMIWKLERDGMTPKMLSLMRELREVRRAKGELENYYGGVEYADMVKKTLPPKIAQVADLYGITSPTGSETSFTFDANEAANFIEGGWSVQEYVELERYQEAMIGNSPATPDGWVMVPVEPTYQMCQAMALSWESPRFQDRYKAMIEAAPDFRENVNSSTRYFLEISETSTNCHKCGGRGIYHCPQMLGTVECECTLSAAPKEVG